MDIEDKVANISLKDVSRNSPLRNSLQSHDTQKVSTGSESDGEPVFREQFMQLVTKARKFAEDGDIASAIKLNEEALTIRFSDKLQRRIAKMKEFLAEQDKDDDDDDEGQMKSLGQGFMLHRKLCEKLYSHQKDGVLWMWSLFLLGKGGILADDMGLGKTIQVIAFLAGLFDMSKIKSVMIVVPLSVLPNWLNEFNKWAPGINVMQFHGSSKKEKERALARVRTRGGVLMTTYGLVVTTKETFAERHGQEFLWDYVILDEGHKIKNPTKTSKSIHQIPAKHRLILTGTPVQNNLKELWSLFDYVHQGSLLGTVRTFKMEFETPIIRARERDATAVEKRLGQEMAQTLKSIIQPYFLRRTKAEVSGRNSSGRNDPKDLKMPTMTRKNDLVIWLHLTETQQQIYQDFTNLDQVKQILMTKKSPLVALTVLKKICDHPRLLSARACLQLRLDDESFNEEDLERPEMYASAASQVNKISDEVLIHESGKMQILVSLLDAFKQGGHRTLVFSQSRKLLDIIQKVITNRGHKVARLDGKVTHLTERDKIVKKFQNDTSFSVFLLTVQVGGVGLTITAADRVIIYDPNWNPATDAQAVDRAYRIGQDKNVVVYRLITCGTVEEKIYRRQVFKDSITKQTTGSNHNPYRYFTKMDLKELFNLDDPKFSKTQRQLQSMHADQRKTDTALDEHIAFLHTLDIFGISDHDLMFQQTCSRDDEEEDGEVVVGEEEELNNACFIDYRVKKAQMLIAEESTGSLLYDQRNKGIKKYPSTVTTFTASGGYRPSPLFHQAVTGAHPAASVNVGSDEDMPDDKSVHETIDLTESDSEGSTPGQNVKMVPATTKKTLSSSSNSPVKEERDRRAFRPLTHEEVQQRSPQTPASTRPGQVVAEELLISPDTRSPIIRLEKVAGHQEMFDKTARDQRFVSSPIKSGQSSPKSFLSAEVLSPTRPTGSSCRNFLDLREDVFLQAGKTSSNKIVSDLGLQLTFPMGATSTPQSHQDIQGNGILANDSTSLNSSSMSSSNVSSPSPRKHLDLSHASRKLSFVVAESDQSFDCSVEESLCPVAKKKHKSHTSFDRCPSSTPRHDRSLLETADGDERTVVMLHDKIHKPKPLQEVSNEADENSSRNDIPSSPKHIFESSEISGEKGRGKVSSKRRSVCLQKRVTDEGSDDDIKQHTGEEDISDESEVEDKENMPVIVRHAGGRNRIVSDSESEGGSFFEVEESEDEDKQSQKTDKMDDRPTDMKNDTSEQDESQRETGVNLEVVEDGKEDEDSEVDEEQDERFQNLISVARSLYKDKNFGESLLYVEEALSIFYDSDLDEMANKIRAKMTAEQC